MKVIGFSCIYMAYPEGLIFLGQLTVLSRTLWQRNAWQSQNEVCTFFGGGVRTPFGRTIATERPIKVAALVRGDLHELHSHRLVWYPRTEPMRIVPLRPSDEREH